MVLLERWVLNNCYKERKQLEQLDIFEFLIIYVIKGVFWFYLEVEELKSYSLVGG